MISLSHVWVLLFSALVWRVEFIPSADIVVTLTHLVGCYYYFWQQRVAAFVSGQLGARSALVALLDTGQCTSLVGCGMFWVCVYGACGRNETAGAALMMMMIMLLMLAEWAVQISIRIKCIQCECAGKMRANKKGRYAIALPSKGKRQICHFFFSTICISFVFVLSFFLICSQRW